MNDRDRLIELIADIQNDFEKWRVECAEDGHKDHQPLGEYLADKLLQNGIIVPICNVGDKVYQTDGVRIYESEIAEIYQDRIAKIIYDTDGIAFNERAIGKTVFLTKEEAEEKLKEREQNG